MRGQSNISGFTIGGTGQLSSITGSPFAGPASVSAIGADKSGSYMVAVGYNGTSGIQLFTVGTTGALTLTTSAGTGTSDLLPRSPCPESLAPPQTLFNPPRIFARTCLPLRF